MVRRSGPSDEAAAPPPPYLAWMHEVKEVEKHFGTSLARGLSADKVASQRALWGANELQKEPPKPLWKLVLEQFDDPLVKAREAAPQPLRPAPPRAGARSHAGGRPRFCCSRRRCRWAFRTRRRRPSPTPSPSSWSPA